MSMRARGASPIRGGSAEGLEIGGQMVAQSVSAISERLIAFA
jgi:hypothetical protein